MPKLSYAQEVAALKEVLAAVRASAAILPPLALSAADELAEQIAEIKKLKSGSGSTPRKAGPPPRRWKP
jgi:hypothetical protein